MMTPAPECRRHRTPGPPRRAMAGTRWPTCCPPCCARSANREPATGPDIAPVRAAALLLIDGLGAQLLQPAPAAEDRALPELPDAGPFRTGFPSSTSISLASLGTGPLHGHARDGRDLLPGRPRCAAGQPALDGARVGGRAVDMRERFPPESVQPRRPLRAGRAAGVTVSRVAPAAFAGSGLTRAGMRGGESAEPGGGGSRPRR